MNWNWPFLRSSYTPAARKISTEYFLDKQFAETYSRQGYVVVKNIVPAEALKLIEDAYMQISQHPEFFRAKGFISSPEYGKKIQQAVFESLLPVNRYILPKIFDLEKCITNFFDILVLKFTEDKSGLIPHQDISIIDEYEGTSSFLWIPVDDVNAENGALMVLPNSHLWGAWQRTHNIHNSPLEKNRASLLKYMMPVYLNRGDLIIFDSALIHASAPNLSSNVRIAMNTAIASKERSMVHYENRTGKTVDCFSVDEQFWKELNFMEPGNVPSRYGSPRKEKLRCTSSLSEMQIDQLVKDFS